jgi:hypothetical protein
VVTRTKKIRFNSTYCNKLIEMYTYKIYLPKKPDGGYTIAVPALPGCITYDEDVDEAF